MSEFSDHSFSLFSDYFFLCKFPFLLLFSPFCSPSCLSILHFPTRLTVCLHLCNARKKLHFLFVIIELKPTSSYADVNGNFPIVSFANMFSWFDFSRIQNIHYVKYEFPFCSTGQKSFVRFILIQIYSSTILMPLKFGPWSCRFLTVLQGEWVIEKKFFASDFCTFLSWNISNSAFRNS